MATVIPAQFDYLRADSLEEALRALASYGDEAKLLAGGHSLIPLMKLRLARPAVLIDIERLAELSFIRDGGDHVSIGALTRHSDLAASGVLASEVPVMAAAAAEVGDPQVRNRGTLGGSLAHGDGAADLPAVVLALGATVMAHGQAGIREIPADRFFEGFLETALTPDEILTEIRVPKAPGAHSFHKFRRRAQDWAIVGVAATRVAGETRIGLINMASVPLRATAVEQALAGGATPPDAAALAAEGIDPPSDIHASTEYRSHLAEVLVGRALADLG